MNYKIKTILIMAISFLLISCSTTNPPEYQSRLHKSFRFNQTYFVYESTSWRPGSTRIKLLAVNRTKTYYGYKSPATTQDYLQNKQIWSEWIASGFDEKYRILGLVDQNTTYRLDKVVIGYETAYQQITIITGQFAGTSIDVRATGWGKEGEMYGEAIKFPLEQ